jgi:glycine betaine transporter
MTKDPEHTKLGGEKRLEIEAAVEEYEINLRRQLDEITQRKAIESEKSSFREELIRRELEDLHRDPEEVRAEERLLINWTLWLSLAISVAVVVSSLVFSDSVSGVAAAISRFMATNLSWFYVLISSCFLIFLVYLAFSRFGQVVLGDPNERPEFSNFSWYSMLFSAGMGVGILFWGAAEPVTHFMNPPVGIAESATAARRAMTLSAFHWGLHAWGIYCVCAVGVAYYGFRKRKKYLISSSIMDVSQSPKVRQTLKLVTDLVATLAIIFGVAASLGLGLLQIGGGAEHVFDIDASGKLGYFVIIASMTALYIISSSTGLDKGIKILSNLNMIVALVLLAFVFVVGPKLFNLKLFVDSIGQYLQALPSLSFKVDPFVESYEVWMRDWTLTYFSWWIAWSPFVGIFIARISRGRTIRELILGSLIVPALFCLLWFSVFGGTALYNELFATSGVGEAVQADVTSALFVFLGELPLSEVTSVVSMALLFTFLITSADSATYVISMMTSEGDLDPSPRMKLMWGLMLAALAYLLVIGGGLEALQAASLVFAFPFSLVLILIVVSVTFRLSIQIRGKRI